MIVLARIKNQSVYQLLEKSAIWLPALLMGSALLIRTDYVDAYFVRVLEKCDNCMRIHVLRHDLPIAFIFISIHATGLFVRSWVLSSILRLAALLIVSIFLIDLVVFDLFSLRLKAIQLTQFAYDINAAWAIFSAYILDQQKWFLALGKLCETHLMRDNSYPPNQS